MFEIHLKPDNDDDVEAVQQILEDVGVVVEVESDCSVKSERKRNENFVKYFAEGGTEDQMQKGLNLGVE